MTKSIFLKRLSATAQFILGFVLGISLIVGISGTLIFAYYKRMSVLPKKPEYPEPQVATEATPNTNESSSNIGQTDIEPSEVNTNDESPQEAISPVTEEPEVEPESEPELPPNAYRAVVTWPDGLSLRAEPDVNAGRVGGISAEASIIILEDSADGKWQRVRLPWSGQEGWVKGGNTRRTSY